MFGCFVVGAWRFPADFFGNGTELEYVSVSSKLPVVSSKCGRSQKKPTHEHAELRGRLIVVFNV